MTGGRTAEALRAAVALAGYELVSMASGDGSCQCSERCAAVAQSAGRCADKVRRARRWNPEQACGDRRPSETHPRNPLVRPGPRA